MLENKTIKAMYEAPKVEVYEVLVEQGFAASFDGTIEDIGNTNDPIGW